MSFFPEFIDALRKRTKENPTLRTGMIVLPILGIVLVVTESSMVMRIVLGVLTVAYGVVAWLVLRRQ